jgi:flagellar hook assembly protein FlgD
MKKIYPVFIVIALMLSILSATSQTDGSIVFSVRTVTNSGEYTPKNVLAIWIENSGGTFIKSFKVMAGVRIQQLYTWKVASGMNTTDATTGATLMNHTTHTINWNCRNLSNTLVADGTYRIRIEFTEAHVQGPLATYEFVKDGTSETINFPDQTYFKDATLTYTAITDISEISEEMTVKVYPNPFTDFAFFIVPDIDENCRLSIFNLSGQLVFSTDSKMYAGKSTVMTWNGLNVHSSETPDGIYLYRIESVNYKMSGKLMKF